MRKIKGDFLKGIITLLVGSGFNQIIPFLASFLLSRFYSPDDFGAFGVFVSFTLIFQNIISLKYDEAICIPQDKKESLLLSYGALGIAILNALLLIIVLLCVSKLELPGKLSQIQHEYFLLAPFYILGGQVINVFYQNCLLQGDYRVVSKTRIWWAGLSSSLKVLLGILAFGVWGLVLGNVTATFLVGVLIWHYIHTQKHPFSLRVDFQQVGAVLGKYRNYSFFSTPSGFFNSLTNVGIPMIMGMFFSPSQVGAYFFMLMVYRNPLGLIQNAISESFKKEANSLFYTNPGVLKKQIYRIQFFMAVIIGFALLLGVFFGDVLFAFFFGPEWGHSGALVKFVALQVFFNGLYNPVSFIGDLLQKQRFVFFFNLSMACTQIMALIGVGREVSFEMGIFVMAIVGAAHFFFINFYMLQHLKNHSIKII